MAMIEFDYTIDTDKECLRGPEGCGGEVFARVSHSGLTRSWMCEGHAEELDENIRAIEHRYPEVNHPDGCTCPGCIGDAW